MRRAIIAAALVAPFFNPIAALALQTEISTQGITRMDERISWARWEAQVQRRLRWRHHVAAVQARLRARWEEPQEATAEIPVPLGDIPKIIYSIFGSYGAKAVSVASCESGLNPWATNSSSGAAGLFQLMPLHWAGRFDPYDPVANTRFAYSLSSGGTDWSAWAGCA